MKEISPAAEQKLEATLLKALAPLEAENPAAYAVLARLAGQGGLANRITKRGLLDLADEILETLGSAGEALDAG